MRAPLTALLAALLLAGAACGEKDEVDATVPAVPAEAATDGPAGEDVEGPVAESVAPGNDDEAEIEQTLERVLTATDPEAGCGALVTPAYVRRSFGDPNGCADAQSPKSGADEVTVTATKVTGDTATAAARVEGGVYDGQELEADLVLGDGIWRLDSLSSDVPVGP